MSDDLLRWFGDSKVRDGDSPLMMFHGTANDFDTFSLIDKERNFPNPNLGFYFVNFAKVDISRGSYFSVTASEYAMYACNLRKVKAYPSVMPVYLKIENPYYVNSYGYITPASALDRQQNEINRHLKAHPEVDGIICRNDKDKQDDCIICVVFDPYRIKSAIGNCGNYDISDSNILK